MGRVLLLAVVAMAALALRYCCSIALLPLCGWFRFPFIVEQKVAIADRAYVLAMGKVVFEDSAANLKDRSRIKKAFLGI